MGDVTLSDFRQQWRGVALCLPERCTSSIVASLNILANNKLLTNVHQIWLLF